MNPATATDRPLDPRAHDAALLQQVAAGDARAFARLHTDHYPAVFRLALATVLDREEAKDVAQEVFVRLLAIAARWEPHATVRTWLHRTTLNVSLGMGRALRRWLRPRPSASGSAANPERVALDVETHDHMHRALARLTPQQRAVTSLHLDAELEPREIAEHLGITANAARVTLHRGLQRLREAMGLAEENAP